MRSSFRLRVRILSAILLLIALVIVARLYMVQIVHGEAYSEAGDHQYVRTGSVLYDRGTIFLSDKDDELVSGATLKSGFLIAINPSRITNPEDVFQKLAPLLPLEHDTFIARASKADDPYEEIASHIDEATVKRIEALDIEGVEAVREQWRYYPGNTLAARTLGFVGYDGDGYRGRYGLERSYEEILSRESDNLYVNFFAEIFANLNVFKSDDAEKAGDIVTTIEPSVQLFLEQELKELMDTWNAQMTAGMIINPRTGEIYALGVDPSFDLNAYGKVEDPSLYGNPFVENVYEMGSIIKALTMASGLDSGAVTAETTYYDEGHLSLNGSTISNFDGRGRGTVNMQEVLNQSLNTGAAFVESSMGHETFRRYMRDMFRLGEKTGIDLPGEVSGLVKNLSSSRDIEYATASYGQGIALTPVQTVRALSVLANNGTITTPHLVKEIQYESGFSKTLSYDTEQVLKPESAEEITRMLVRVVDEALRGGTVKLDHYSIAAKTGTAQIADSENGGYYDDRYLHSFFGYFPAYDPKFLVFFLTLEPQGVRYASETLTEPFMDMVEFLINYYEVSPDR